jgi:hypothetical protein
MRDVLQTVHRARAQVQVNPAEDIWRKLAIIFIAGSKMVFTNGKYGL